MVFLSYKDYNILHVKNIEKSPSFVKKDGLCQQSERDVASLSYVLIYSTVYYLEVR